MKLFKGWRVKVAVSAIGGIIVAILMSCGDRSSSDGAIYDRGFFSYYPRVTVKMPTLQIGQGAYEHTIRDLPLFAYSLRLVVREANPNLGPGPPTWPEAVGALKKAGVRFEVEIRDSRGQAKEFGGFVNDWHHAAWGPESFYETEELRDLQLGRGPVTVRVQATAARPEILPDGLRIQPDLVGGGFRK